MMLENNDANETEQFYDCFTKHGFWDEHLSRYWNPASDHNHSTCVFYPHGALHLARDKQGNDKKIFADGASALLSTIISQWSNNKSLPLFVSEGNSGSKLAAIKRSDYLLKVYNDILPKSGPTLVIYGWSMDKTVDGHILDQITGGNYEKIAVHVHRPTTDIDQFINNTNEKLKRCDFEEITYFELD